MNIILKPYYYIFYLKIYKFNFETIFSFKKLYFSLKKNFIINFFSKIIRILN